MAEQSYSFPYGIITGSLDISGANTVITAHVPIAMRVTRIHVHVGVVTATAAETMTVKRLPIPGDDTTSAATMGSFPVAAGLAAGAEVRVKVTPFNLNAFERVSFTCGNSTGTGTVYFVVYGHQYITGPVGEVSFSAQTKEPWTGVGTINYAAWTDA